MTVLRQGLLLLTLCLLSVPGVAQEPKQADPKDPKADPATLGGLTQDVLEKIDRSKKDDLFQKVKRAENILSVKGQSMLRERALLEIYKAQADEEVKSLNANPEVKLFKAVLENPAFKGEAEKLNKRPEKEFNEEMPLLLDKYKVKATGLIKFQELQDATEAQTLAEKKLQIIEDQFAKNTAMPVGGGIVFVPGSGILTKVQAVQISPTGGATGSRPMPMNEPSPDARSAWEKIFGKAKSDNK